MKLYNGCDMIEIEPQDIIRKKLDKLQLKEIEQNREEDNKWADWFMGQEKIAQGATVNT